MLHAKSERYLYKQIVLAMNEQNTDDNGKAVEDIERKLKGLKMEEKAR